MGNDKLQEVNQENICDVLQALKRDWPSSIHVKDAMINRVMIHSQIKDYEKVKQLLLETDGIDWSLCPEFEAVFEKDIPLIKEICKIKDKPCFSDGLFNQMWLSSEKQQAITITISPDVYIGELTEEHVPRVNDTWRYKFPGSEQLARDAIVYNKGMGLFRKADGKLVAWVLVSHFGALGMLYTEDNERGKGYGKLISLALSKYLVDIEIDPYVCVRVNNTQSFSLYKKIGFEITDKVTWILTSKVNDVLHCDKN
ncbi:uncharacterized protein LOC142321642 isoform X2 [Lycorma delicatula]|uniref:uncharacterized protein LOC142321642 isoform X2 n=1 Tax=Lycorma delicatula TaxID=130591 RepID=UPI003F50F0A6